MDPPEFPQHSHSHSPYQERYRRLPRSSEQRGRIPTRQTCFVLLVFSVLVTFFMCYDGQTLSHGETIVLKAISNHPLLNWTRKVSPESSCRIPLFSAFSKEILPYFKVPPNEISCKKREISLSRMHIDKNKLEIFGSARTYSCFVEDLIRDGDNAIKFGNARPVGVGLHLLEIRESVQAIRVSCRNFLGLDVYSHIHLVQPKFALHEHIADGEGRAAAKNILLFGIDSVSNLAAIRLLPKTYLFLVNNLSAVVLKSHHKVGENTFPNLITILTGAKRTHPAEIKDGKDLMFDSWPLIWKNFAEIGYETFYGEDFPEFATFNYLADGFKNPPTNHYLRPFWLAIRESRLIRSSSNLCYGGTPKHELQLNYLKNFLRRKREHPYFALSFLVEISHEYQELLGAADESIVQALESVQNQVLSGETLLIFLSDHGHRFDSIRQTRQGHLEERLPFVAIATLNAEQKSVLRYNSEMLTSHYDLFETLRSHLPSSHRPAASKFGIDLLSEKVPRNRTCADAGVLDIYCTCANDEPREGSGTPVGYTDSDVREFADRAVDFINSMLANEHICARLALSRVVATFLMSAEKVVTFETNPGGAVFEVTFKRLSDELQETQFSRINRYGEPCIPDQVLRKYCFCDK